MRFPIVPTVIVAAAIATMVALGVWQLGRMNEKEALIARYETALEIRPMWIGHRQASTKPACSGTPRSSAATFAR